MKESDKKKIGEAYLRLHSCNEEEGMTDEEAIKIIKQFRDRQGNSSDDIEALDKAIKALEVVKIIEDAYMSELLKTPMERNVPISDPCDGCQYELNSTNGNPCYSCGKYKLTEQQPCEDCISRQAVLDKKELVELEDGQSFYCINPKDVETLPSVTPSRPKGRWIGHIEHCKKLGLKPSGLGAYEWCSKCDCGVDIIEFYSIHYNFCPNCGADMRESGGEK